MESLRLAFGYLTGLQLVSAMELDWPTLLATAVLVNICNAIVCRLVARNNGRPARAWTVLGFVFGVWAVAVVLASPKRA